MAPPLREDRAFKGGDQEIRLAAGLGFIDDGRVIDGGRAVRLVDEVLRAEEREFAERGHPVTLVISRVTEHRLGWIIDSQSETYGDHHPG